MKAGRDRIRRAASRAVALALPVALLLALAAPLALAPAAGAAQPDCGFPGTDWGRADPESVGLDPDRLQDALDFATQRQSETIAVYRHGCLVAEDRLADTARQRRFESFSMAKSVTAMLTGRAVTLGYLSVEDPVGAFVPEADAAHGAIRVRDLLTMSSGLHWNFFRDYNVFTPGDRVKDALTLPFDHEPGTFFEYHQSPVTLLAKVVERAVGVDYQQFAQDQLFGPVGIAPDTWSWARDDAGNTLGFHGLMMRRDDFARLGHLMRHHGVWSGRRLISERYFGQAVAPSSSNAGYGYLFWLNCCKPHVAPTIETRDVRDHRLVESLPEDMYAMVGFQEQRVWVLPGLDMMVVRLGVTGDRDPGDASQSISTAEAGEFEHELGRRLMRAVRDATVPDPGPYSGQRALVADPDYGLFRSALDAQDFTAAPGTDVELGPAGPPRARTLTILSYRLRPSRRGVLRVKVACPAQPGRDCAGKLSLRVRLVRGKYLYAGGARLSLRRGTTGRVALRLGRRAARVLARRKRLSGFASAVNRDGAGGARTQRGVRIGRARR
ncbi:MAG TPA: serine hydrolase [Thermoleophilaceae bacterium]|jgi:CubicO group peptidase (beta-lactamase class C family)